MTLRKDVVDSLFNHARLEDLVRYSGAPLNDYLRQAATLSMVDTRLGPNCIAIQNSTNPCFAVTPLFRIYSGQLSRSQLYANNT